MQRKMKTWVKPRIEEVALEAEEDVLATCYTSSQTTRSAGSGCRSAKCATYP